MTWTGPQRLGAVRNNAELKRILNIERRAWLDDVDDRVAWMTNALKTPGGDMTLLPVQAQALFELGCYGGIFCPIPVGGGKTLITLLASVVTGAKRPVLLIPASLVEKTRRDFVKLSKHFRCVLPEIVTYTKLGMAKYADWLETRRPDLLIADEGHKLKNPKAGVTKRVRRYLGYTDVCRFVTMSGTATQSSVLDYADPLLWATGWNCPLPMNYNDRQLWAGALDADNRRVWAAPGALKQLCDVEETELWESGQERKAARSAYSRRLFDTPGVVGSLRSSCSASITIKHVKPKSPSPTIEAALTKLYDLWELPNGEELVDALEVARHARELALGFYYVWETTPPADWMKARKAWAAVSRQKLGWSRTLDTDAQIRLAFPDNAALRAWEAVKESYTPTTRAVWICNDILDHCATHIAGKGRHDIVWVNHRAFGVALSFKTSVPYYAAKGRDTVEGEYIEDHAPGMAMIASQRANREGRNLQAWSSYLVVDPPANNEAWEQMIGRVHRQNQKADTIRIQVLTTHAIHRKGFARAMQQAEYTYETMKAEQKLLLADVL